MAGRLVKLMVSHGGRIERADGKPPKYVGGEHLILSFCPSVSPSGLRDLLAARAGFSDSDFSIKYCVSGEGPDALCDVDTDEDLSDMVDLTLFWDLRISLFGDEDRGRYRLFLFRDAAVAPAPTSVDPWPSPVAPAPSSQAQTQALVQPAPMRRIATAPTLLPAKPTNVDWWPSEALAAPSPVQQRIPTSPSTMWETSTAATSTSKPPLAPSLPRRIASAPLLSAGSTDATASLTITTSTPAARATQGTRPHAPAPAPAFQPAEKSNPACRAAPVFLVPAVPQVIIYRPPIILMPVFSGNVAKQGFHSA